MASETQEKRQRQKHAHHCQPFTHAQLLGIHFPAKLDSNQSNWSYIHVSHISCELCVCSLPAQTLNYALAPYSSGGRGGLHTHTHTLSHIHTYTLHTHSHTYTLTHTHTHTHTRIFAHNTTYTLTHIHTTYTHTHTHTHSRIFTHTHYIHTHIHTTYTHTHTHTHTHAHTHTTIHTPQMTSGAM